MRCFWWSLPFLSHDNNAATADDVESEIDDQHDKIDWDEKEPVHMLQPDICRTVVDGCTMATPPSYLFPGNSKVWVAASLWLWLWGVDKGPRASWLHSAVLWWGCTPRPMYTPQQMFKTISKWCNAHECIILMLNHASGRRTLWPLTYSGVPKVKKILGTGDWATKNKPLSFKALGECETQDFFKHLTRWRKAVGKTLKDPNLPVCNIDWTQLPIHKNEVLQDMKNLLEVAHVWHFCPRLNNHTTRVYMYM